MEGLHDKGKPVERRGRKATGLKWIIHYDRRAAEEILFLGVPAICGGSVMKKTCLFPQFAGILLLILLALPAGAGNNQAQHEIKVEIPELLQLEVGPAEIVFDLAHPNHGEPFPAPSYPSYYTPTSNQQYLPVRVYTNGKTGWRLLIYGETDQGLGEGAIEWSLDGTNWFQLKPTEQVLTTGGYTNGWLELKVYFRLVLRGLEYARLDVYKVKVNYQLSSV